MLRVLDRQAFQEVAGDVVPYHRHIVEHEDREGMRDFHTVQDAARRAPRAGPAQAPTQRLRTGDLAGAA
jgi:hypothetical protein